MTTQRQEQRPNLPHEYRSKRPSWTRWLIASIVLLFIVVGTIIWILTSRTALTAILPIVIFTVLGVLIALFQWLFPVSSNAPENPSAHPHSPQIPQNAPVVHQAQPIIAQIPPKQPLFPLPPLPDEVSYRGIAGLPPPTDPRTIQQREHVVREVYTKLTQPDITAIALTGIGGVGKSTLAALIYHYAEEQCHARFNPFFAETFWLTVDSAVTFADLAGNLFEALGKPLPDLSNLAPQNQAVALFNALNIADEPRLIILDQFENLLNWDTGRALTDRPGVGEWLDIINSQQCACRILLTSRLRPVGTREYPPTYLQEYAVGGLDDSEGIALLRNQGVQGTDAELQTAVSYCAGHAFSLTLLASLMRDHHMNLTMLLKDSVLWTGDIATNLLDQIYTQQLNDIQRQLLVAFSVYREPVPLDAALSVVSMVSKGKVQFALKTLLIQHLIEAVGEGRYQLHAIVAAYALSCFDENNEVANAEALREAHGRAAKYYQQHAAISCPPGKKRRQISDIHDFIEAVWHRMQAEQWQIAYDLMEQEGIFSDLKRWGAYAILLELYQPLLPLDKWHPERLQAAYIYNNLGVIYRVLGMMNQARENLLLALRIFQEEEDRRGEASSLNNLGWVYANLSQYELARDYDLRALEVYKELGDIDGELETLNYLGWVYYLLGQMEHARYYTEQALKKTVGAKEEWESTW